MSLKSYIHKIRNKYSVVALALIVSDDVGFAVPFTKAREKVSVRGSGVQQSKHNVIICRAIGRSENPKGASKGG